MGRGGRRGADSDSGGTEVRILWPVMPNDSWTSGFLFLFVF